MNYKLQTLTLPKGCKILRNEFTTYDPEVDFTEERNIYYLTEDLLQLEFEHTNIVIDLGWYENISATDGEFRIFVIQNMNWEKPLRVETSKSQKRIYKKLEMLLMEVDSILSD